MVDTRAGTPDVPAQGEPARERRDPVNDRLRLVLDNTGDVIVHYTVDGVLLWASPSLRRVLGWVPDDCIGTRFEFGHPDDRPLLLEALQRAEEQGEDTVVTRTRALAHDGSIRWVHGVTRLVRAADGSLESFVSSVRDISEQVAVERALAQSERHYRLLAENSADVVIHTGSDGLIAWVSPSSLQLLGRGPDDLVGRRVVDLMHPADVSRTTAFIRESLALGRTGGRTEARFDVGGGKWRWMSMVGRALFDDDGGLIGGIDTLRDIQAEHDARDELRRLATRDPLTGLANRRQLVARLAVELGHRVPREDARPGVLFVDVDRLKQLNDAHGHQVGDDVLVELAHRLTASVRLDDIVSRFGGDEFVVLLPDLPDLERAQRIAAAVHSALTRPVRVEGSLIDVTVSIGVALALPGDTPDTLLRRADTALYRAKNEGRGLTAVDPG